MPRYIGYRPQFNPVSLQEYLAVPTMLQQEYDTYEDKYNENLDKLAVLEGMLDDSTKNYLDAYKNNLNNAADIISGKSGNLSDLRQQVSSARQFYREYAPRLTNAYNKRQAALKTQQELLLKDPSAITTQVGNMQSFLDNPDQTFHTLSGDKIYADMINAGKLSAADINNPLRVENFGRGYLKQINQKGYTLAQQQEYANLVQQALSNNPDIAKKADEALRNNPIYAQPYQVLNKYIEDNKFNLFDSSQQSYAINKALSGQLMGMTGTVDERLIQDRAWNVKPVQNNRPKTYRQQLADIKLEPIRFGSPVTQIGKFDSGVQLSKKYGNIITQDGNQTSVKNREGVLKALHLPTNLKDYEINYFIGDNGFKSLEELNERLNSITENKVFQLIPYSGDRKLTKEENDLVKEYTILTNITSHPKDYEAVTSQFNELNSNYSAERSVVNTGIRQDIPFIPKEQQASRTNVDRLSQMIGKAKTTVKTDENAQRLGLTETGIGSIEYPLNSESLQEVIAKVTEGGVEIYGIDRLNMDKEGNISPKENKIKFKNAISKVNGGDKFTHGALYNIPDANGYVLYMTDNKGNGLNFWIPGTQILPNYESDINILTDATGRKIKFSELVRQLNEADQWADYYNNIANSNPTEENIQLAEDAAYNALILHKLYKGDIDNRGAKLLNSRIYKTAGTFDVNTSKPREAMQSNILDELPID